LLKWLLVIVVGVAVITLAGPWLAQVYLPITTTIVLSLALTLLGRLV